MSKTEDVTFAKPANLSFPADPARKWPACSGDWQYDGNGRTYKDADGDDVPYCAHFVPPTRTEGAKFTGPEDAYVWFGLPYEGNPWINRLPDPNKPDDYISVQPYVDASKHSSHFADVEVKWIAWDESTGCNVYQRMPIGVKIQVKA